MNWYRPSIRKLPRFKARSCAAQWINECVFGTPIRAASALARLIFRRDKALEYTVIIAQSGGLGDNRIGQDTDFFDFDFHFIAGLQPDGRFPGHADAFRRAGKNDRSGQQGR